MEQLPARTTVSVVVQYETCSTPLFRQSDMLNALYVMRGAHLGRSKRTHSDQAHNEERRRDPLVREEQEGRSCPKLGRPAWEARHFSIEYDDGVVHEQNYISRGNEFEKQGRNWSRNAPEAAIVQYPPV